MQEVDNKGKNGEGRKEEEYANFVLFAHFFNLKLL